jgi:2-oxoglutarate/2-oxoacid ferredoxin oxidoreductase subunit alpha
MNDYSILIGGAAGAGSKKAGLIIAKFFSRYGYQIYIYEDYQSLIRGGHNFSLIRASDKKVTSSREDVDFLLALDEETFKKHEKSLNQKGISVFDSSDNFSKKGIAVPATETVKKLNGIPIMKNTALISAFSKIVGIDWQTVKKVLEQELPIETSLNLKIAQDIYQKTDCLVKIKKRSLVAWPLVSGNEAIALGSLKAGLESYIAYPMTPATGVLNYLAGINSLTVFQPENEIAAVNMAIGSSYSGKRTMTGTSGGGFCLMNEAISLSAQAEVPLVVLDSQRSGPSTGVPTYNGQSDLLHVLSSGHGDFTRFVVAPGDAEEAFFLSGLALNIAWKYQIPSIILSDKEVSESTFSFDSRKIQEVFPEKIESWDNKKEYLRYQKTKSGISPLAFPGQKNIVVKTTSYEHDEKGIAVEDAKSIKEMQDKRIRKFESLRKEVNKIKCVNVYGNKNSKKALIFWGSVKGAAIEASKKLGIKAVQIMIFQPFPEKQLKKALEKVEKLISVETNASGQMTQLVKNQGINVAQTILKYDGRPFTAQEIIKKIKK